MRVTVKRHLGDWVTEVDFAVLQDCEKRENDGALNIKLREEGLEVDAEVEKSVYHLKDIITGWINVKKIRNELKTIEVQITREECVPPSKCNRSFS